MKGLVVPVKRHQPVTKPTKPKTRVFWVCVCLLLLAVGAVIGFGWTRFHDNSTVSDTLEPATNQTSTLHDCRAAETRSVLLVIGDSLTERGEQSDQSGWVTLLRRDYSRSADIISRGYGGYNTRWTLEYVLPLVEQDLEVLPPPALISVWLGANDAALADGRSARQHVPVADYRANLVAIVKRMRAKAPSANVLLVTPPPVDDDVRRDLSSDHLDRSNEQAAVYAAACVAAAEQANVAVLDLHSFFSSLSESERNACLLDGLHFNARGNKLVKQQIRTKIQAEFPQLAAKLATPQLPPWDTLASLAAATKTRAFWVFAAVAAVVVIATTTATQIGSDAAEHESPQVVNRSVLMFIGDSITEYGESSDQAGWITVMRSQFSRSADILSRGYIGYNTRWTLQYVLPLIELDLDKLPTPALFTVWLGANDAVLADGSSYLQHVPVAEYSANLLAIVDRLRSKAPAANILLITPPPVDEDRRRSLNNGSLERSNEQAGVYAAACVSVAAQANVAALDLYSFFNARDDRNAALVDGLHFNAKGNQLAQQQLVAAIKDAFPSLAAALATPQLPDWRVLLNER